MLNQLMLFALATLLTGTNPWAERNNPLTNVMSGPRGQWVNPFIGTGGVSWVCGNNFPGAMTPFGMVRLGPETNSTFLGKRALNTSGYYFGDDQILGFSHTRLNGTGATDGGHFLVVPSNKPIDPKKHRLGKGMPFSHKEEFASPGYYAVKLPTAGVLAEITASPRVGVHRYTFNPNENPHILLDVMNTLGGKKSTGGKLHVLPKANEIEGEVQTFGTFAGRYGGLRVYFVARFSQPFTSYQTWKDDIITQNQPLVQGEGIAVDLGFVPTNQSQSITVKLAISHVSIENARTNLQTEVNDQNFEWVLAKATAAWEEKLALIDVEGGTNKQKTIFYTSVYRTFQMPTIFNDSNGEYLGFDKKVHRVSDFQYFTDLSLWDTFRTVHPLYTLIAKKDQRDMVVSLIKMLEQGGWLPRWPSGNGYTNSMLGTPADIVIADSYLKGIREFDVERAYQAMRATALEPTPPGAKFSGRKGINDYLKYQYCPSDLMRESVSRTLEFGWEDFAISQLAKALGKKKDAALFEGHSKFYRNLWNPKTGYFQPRDSWGEFFEPFKPLLLTYMDQGGKFTKDYVEGSALQWRWSIPYDGPGLISLFKSQDFFIEELNQFFAKSNPLMGAWNPGPYYWHGNQPDIAAAYLFNDANRPDLTQKWCRWILENKYGDGPSGLDGNDDGGTLSAWFVFSSIGLYPIAGSEKYQLGAPLFRKAELKLNDKRLVVIAENYDPKHHYVEKILLNGVPINRHWILHKEVENGGILQFWMSPNPNSPKSR
jgi:predicted alpha-1,2-mannosidase